MDPQALKDPLLTKKSSQKSQKPEPKRPFSTKLPKTSESPEFQDKNLSDTENLHRIDDFSSSDELSNNENLSSTTFWKEKKQEALNFLLEKKDDPSLEIHFLAYQGNYKEIEKIVKQEWVTVDAIVNQEKKYISKGRVRWPFVKITENEKFVLVKQESIRVSLCKIKKNRKVKIGKNLGDLKLKMKKDSLGFTPLIYAIWGEEERLLQGKNAKTSEKESNSKTSSFIFYCNFESYSSGTSKKINKIIRNELAHVFIHTRLNEALDEIIIKDYSKLLHFIFESLKEKGLEIENELKLEGSLSLSIHSKSRKCFELIIELIFQLISTKIEESLKNHTNIDDEQYSHLILCLESYLNCVDMALKFDLNSCADCLGKNYLEYLSSPISCSIIVKKDYSNLLTFIIENGKFEITKENEKSLLFISIESKANKCVGIIFEYIIRIIKESKMQNKMINPYLLKIIEDEISEYLTAPSTYLKEFLSLLTEEKSKQLMENQRDLPKCKMIDEKSQIDDAFKSYFAKQEYMNVKIFNPVIKLPGVFGSNKSIKFLKQLEAADNIQLYKNEIIKHYILYKWKNLWRLIFFQDMLVLSNIPLLVIIIYSAKNNHFLEMDSYVIWGFIIINSFLAILELFQLIALKPLDYFGIHDIESTHTLAFLRVLILGIEPLMIILRLQDYVLFNYFEIFRFFMYAIISSIINSSTILKIDLRSESVSKDLVRVILLFLPSILCFGFWVLYDFIIYLSSGIFFILLMIVGFLLQKNDDQYHKWRICCSVIKLVFCVISLCLDNYFFQFFIIFEAINLGCIITDISIIWNKVKWQHVLIDSILLFTISLNFIYIEYYFLRILVTLICLLSLFIDYYFFDINDIQFMDIELLYCWSILFLLGINPSKSIFQSLIIFILGVSQTAYWDSEDRIYSMRFLYKSQHFINLNTIDFARMILCGVWINSIFSKSQSMEVTYALTVLTCIRGLTTFRSFDGTRYYIRLISNSIKDISSFMIIFFYSTLCFGIISRVNLDNFGIQDIWIYSYYINLGEFRNEKETFNLEYFTFVVATVVNVIIMLNLLISILGDSFDKFQISSQEIDCMEMASVVLEIESIMFFNRNADDDGKFLVVCDVEAGIKYNWDGKIMMIKKQLDDIGKNMVDKKILDERFENTNEKIEKGIKEMNEKIMENKIEMIKAIQRIEDLLEKKKEVVS